MLLTDSIDTIATVMTKLLFLYLHICPGRELIGHVFLSPQDRSPNLARGYGQENAH